MPRLKSAIKRVKTNERNRLYNISFKSGIKTLSKKVFDLASQKDLKSAKEAASEAFALIDKAHVKGIIHLNNAARKKSRISKWLKAIEPKSKS